jgi:hypothetical protein
MIDEQTIQKLCDLKLHAMADALRELLVSAPGSEMSFEEKLGLVVEREWTDRENRRLARRLKEAKLGMSACLEDVWCEPGRGLDKAGLSPRRRESSSCGRARTGTCGRTASPCTVWRRTTGSRPRWSTWMRLGPAR